LIANEAAMFARSKTETREFFRATWRKRCAGLLLEPLEVLVADVIAAHPEYHALIADSSPTATPDQDPAHNPFLHLGLHVALHEQLQADRPVGLRAEYQRLKTLAADGHATEHRLMQVLAEVLWAAQAAGRMPDEQQYLASLRQLR
jgi:Domain of unknown function (DUF1841)